MGEVQNDLPTVPQPPEMSFEEFAMLAITGATPGFHGTAPLMFWWLVKLSQGKEVEWIGPTALADMMGIDRQGVYRNLKILQDRGFLRIDIEAEPHRMQALVPGEVREEQMVCYALNKIKLKLPFVIQPNKISTNAVSTEQPVKQDSPTQQQKNLESDPKPPLTNSKPQAARAKLTPENLCLITANHSSMRDYLLYGLPGVLEPDLEKRKLLPVSPLNWRQFVILQEGGNTQLSEESLGLKNWNVQTFMGYFWFRVSFWRETRKIPQTLPSFNRLAGTMKNLLKSAKVWDVYQFILAVTEDFDLLCCIAGRHTDNMLLDETVLTHSSIRNAAQQYLGVGEHQRAAYREQYAEQLKVRFQQYMK